MLDSVGLDEENICCLCRVSTEKFSETVSAFILVLMRRDDFLIGESSAVAAKTAGGSINELKVIDVGEAVLNFILSSDLVDHQRDRLLPLFEFLKEGGEVGEIITKASRQSILACGDGRFILEVSISIPSERDENGHGESLLMLDRQLVLFSISAGAIVWMGASYPSEPYPENVAIVVASSRHRHFGRLRNDCSIAFVPSHSSWLMMCDIDRSGFVNIPSVVKDSSARRSFLHTEGYQMYSSNCLLLSTGCIVMKDAIYRSNDDGDVTDARTCLSFFPFSLNVKEPIHTTHTFHDRVHAHDMIVLRDEYIVLVCTEFVDEETLHSDDEAATIATTSSRLIFLVVHIACQAEICRIPFSCRHSDNYSTLSPRLIHSPTGGTLALALGGHGIALAGEDIRFLGYQGDPFLPCEDSLSPSKTGSKKKKTIRVKKHGSKKDGFARGMSLRG